MLQVIEVQKVNESVLPSLSLSYSVPFCGDDQNYWFLLCISIYVFRKYSKRLLLARKS